MIASRNSVLRYCVGGRRGLQDYRQLKRLVKQQEPGNWKVVMNDLLAQEMKRLGTSLLFKGGEDELES